MCYHYLCLASCECSNCDPDGIYREMRWQACMIDIPQSLNDLDI